MFLKLLMCLTGNTDSRGTENWMTLHESIIEIKAIFYMQITFSEMSEYLKNTLIKEGEGWCCLIAPGV